MSKLRGAKYREQHPELFDAEEFEAWAVEWDGMPEYTQQLLTPYRSVTFHFRSESDFVDFAKRLEMNLSKGRSFWFPAGDGEQKAKLRYVDEVPR